MNISPVSLNFWQKKVTVTGLILSSKKTCQSETFPPAWKSIPRQRASAPAWISFMKLNQTFISRLAGILFTPSVERNPAGVFTPAQKLLWNGHSVRPWSTKSNFQILIFSSDSRSSGLIVMACFTRASIRLGILKALFRVYFITLINVDRRINRGCFNIRL